MQQDGIKKIFGYYKVGDRVWFRDLLGTVVLVKKSGLVVELDLTKIGEVPGIDGSYARLWWCPKEMVLEWLLLVS